MKNEYGIGLSVSYLAVIGYEEIMNPRVKKLKSRVIIGDWVTIRHGAIIYTDCKIGNKTMIGHHVVIREATKIGAYCKIGHGTVLEGAIRIGDHTSIQPLCLIAAYTQIGSYVFMGPGVITTNDPIMNYKRPNIEVGCYSPVIIGDGARIGAGCTIVPGVTIGREAKIGAGSLVTKDIPDFKRAIGNPIIIGKDVPEAELLKNNGIDI